MIVTIVVRAFYTVNIFVALTYLRIAHFAVHASPGNRRNSLRNPIKKHHRMCLLALVIFKEFCYNFHFIQSVFKLFGSFFFLCDLRENKRLCWYTRDFPFFLFCWFIWWTVNLYFSWGQILHGILIFLFQTLVVII